MFIDLFEGQRDHALLSGLGAAFHGEGLATSGLAVGEHAHVVAVQRALRRLCRRFDALKGRRLRRVDLHHETDGAAVHVQRPHHAGRDDVAARRFDPLEDLENLFPAHASVLSLDLAGDLVGHPKLFDGDHGLDRHRFAAGIGAPHRLFDRLLRGHADLFQELAHGHVEIVAHGAVALPIVDGARERAVGWPHAHVGVDLGPVAGFGNGR